ncbi:MAG: hypothetical protein JXJ04_26135 [Spirochaetales bacterium]|nr:hypothetical protein [Spirochaetales bacterium]
MLSETLTGTALLISEKKIDFLELIDEVATKGGTTEGGVDVLNTMLPEVYKNMFEKMIERQNTRKKKYFFLEIC